LATHQSTLRQEASIDKAMIDIHFYFDFISPIRGLKVPIGWMSANFLWVFEEHLLPNNCRASTVRQLGS
jgi:hypothetical protein